MKKPEWTRYSVEDQNQRSFSTVRHTAHFTDAIRIIEDGVIRSSLVWDQSRLNNSRTCVSWLSPNQWAYGSIYGNVSFEFNWGKIIEGKSLYWVEDVKSYRPPAYRILVTYNDYDLQDNVVPYDPAKSAGPICLNDNSWYRNDNYTGEFMVDSDLSLKDCQKVIFVDHHPRLCAKFGSSCSELDLSRYDVGCMVLANLIGRGLRSAKRLFLKKQNDEIKFTIDVKAILRRLIQEFVDDIEDTNPIFKRNDAKILLKAALLLYSEKRYDEAFRLSDFLGTKRAVTSSFRRILSEFFGIKLKDIADQLRLQR